MKKVFLSLLVLGISIAGLAGCNNKSAKSNGTAASSAKSGEVKDEEQAKKDAQVLLDYMYQGRRSGQLNDVTNQSADSIRSYMLAMFSDKKKETFKKDHKEDDLYLIVDDSKYFASDIVDEFAAAYVDQIQKVPFEIEKVEVSGKDAKITVSYHPIAALQEANPIGAARTELFGGMDEEEFIRKSQNKDIKAIESMISYKLYAMYYGDMAKEAEKVDNAETMTFTLTKKGDHYMANEDIIHQLALDARADSYKDNKPKEGTKDSKETSESSSESSTESKTKKKKDNKTDESEDKSKDKLIDESSDDTKKL